MIAHAIIYHRRCGAVAPSCLETLALWAPRRAWRGGASLEWLAASAASPIRIEPRSPRKRSNLAYVIAEPCIGTKDNSCVEVCPVDCIHPTPDEPGYDAAEMLYIDPEECIDCDACVEACPVDACFAEDQLPEEWQKYTQINADYYRNGGAAGAQ